MAAETLTAAVSEYLAAHPHTGEQDLIGALVAILEPHAHYCKRWGECTETNPLSDVYCGSRSMLEHALIVLHGKTKL